jgi:hypothetical protein
MKTEVIRIPWTATPLDFNLFLRCTESPKGGNFAAMVFEFQFMRYGFAFSSGCFDMDIFIDKGSSKKTRYA